MKKLNNIFSLLKIIFFLTVIVLPCHYNVAVGDPTKLEINKSLFDFGNVQYMQTKCESLIFRNTGDSTLTISSIDPLNVPFNGNIVYPNIINSGDSLVFNICYQPVAGGRDSQRVFVQTEIRASHSTALLFDFSTSMGETLSGSNIRKIDAADTAAKYFIQDMLLTPAVRDEAGIFSFSYDFNIKQDFTTNKNLLIDSLPYGYPYGESKMYEACVKTILLLKNRPYEKVLILLTDGYDENRKPTYQMQDVVDSANAYHVEIYTIGIGNQTDDITLSYIADSTGGQYFKATTMQDLIDIYGKIFNLFSSKVVTSYFDLAGVSTAPDLQMNCPSNLDVKPGDTVAYSISLQSVAASQALNQKYSLNMSFDPTVLFPIDTGIAYKNDGHLSLNRTNTVNIDSFPVATVRFVVLLGDSVCTNLILESLVWENPIYPPILSSSSCSLCMSACALDLRHVTTSNPVNLYQNVPNPVGSSTEIKFDAGQDGHYRLDLYDALGRKLMNLADGEYKTGTYKINLETAPIPNGTYVYVLSAPGEVHSRMMVIIR